MLLYLLFVNLFIQVLTFIHQNPDSTSLNGRCTDFLSLNNLFQLCQGRNDQCYMNHFTTRCYCDTFCTFDCCQDHPGNNPEKQTTTEITPGPDPCTHNKCLNGASCVPADNWYLCKCSFGFFGINCQFYLNSCKLAFKSFIFFFEFLHKITC